MKGAIFCLHTSHGDEYHIGPSALDTHKVSKEKAMNFIATLALSGETISYFKDPFSHDELWETE